MTSCHSIILKCQKKDSENMPSQTFLNLTEEKKQNLLKAATLEFSRVNYNTASINQIILNAGISRGSFYMYFKDKEDLYVYIFEYYKNLFQKRIALLLEKNGDFIETFEQLFDEIIKYCKNNNQAYFKNLFLDMKFTMERKLLQKPKIEELNKQKKLLLKIINKSLYKYKTEEDLYDAFSLVLMITLTALVHYFIDDTKYQKIKDAYMNRLHIIKYGLYERND
ncbi:MAG: TetR/AcrR family transcriptional regulator [Bacilli bacterium]